MNSGFDLAQMEAFIRSFESAEEELLRWLVNFIRDEAVKVVSDAKRGNPGTPTDTGALLGAYRIKGIKLRGDVIEATVINIQYYASFIEYGHRQVRAVGNDTWYEGVFMLTLATERVRQKLPKRFENSFKRFLKKHGVQ